MWQKFKIEANIKRSVILFNLFQMQLGEWYVVVHSMDDKERLISVDVRSHFWRRNQCQSSHGSEIHEHRLLYMSYPNHR